MTLSEILVLLSILIPLSPPTPPPSPAPASCPFVTSAAYNPCLTLKQPPPLPPPLFILNYITATPFFSALTLPKYTVSSSFKIHLRGPSPERPGIITLLLFLNHFTGYKSQSESTSKSCPYPTIPCSLPSPHTFVNSSPSSHHALLDHHPLSPFLDPRSLLISCFPTELYQSLRHVFGMTYHLNSAPFLCLHRRHCQSQNTMFICLLYPSPHFHLPPLSVTPSCHLLLLSTCLSLPLKQKSLPSFMPLKTNNAILTQFLPPYLKNVQTFSSQLQPTSSIYLCQPAHFPCNSKIQSSNHFSKSHPWTRNSFQTTIQSRIYLSYPNCRNESSSPVSMAISPQTIS